MSELVPWLVEGGFAVGMLAFMWKLNADSNRKSNTLFKRFDEYKAHIEGKLNDDFVSKEMCKVIREHGNSDFARLERRVEEGFRNIDKKITELMKHNV